MAFYTGRPTGRNITSDVAQLASQMAQGGTGTTLNAPVASVDSSVTSSALPSTSPAGFNEQPVSAPVQQAPSYAFTPQQLNDYMEQILTSTGAPAWKGVSEQDWYSGNYPWQSVHGEVTPYRAPLSTYWGNPYLPDYVPYETVKSQSSSPQNQNNPYGYYDDVNPWTGQVVGQTSEYKKFLDSYNAYNAAGAGQVGDTWTRFINNYGTDGRNFYNRFGVPDTAEQPIWSKIVLPWVTAQNRGYSDIGNMGSVYDANKRWMDLQRRGEGSSFMEQYVAPSIATILAAVASYYIGGALAAPVASTLFGSSAGAGSGLAAAAGSVGSGMSGLASAGGAAGLAGGSLAAGGMGAATGLGSMAGGLAGGGIGLGSAGGSAALGSALSTATGNALVNTVTGAAKSAGSGDWRDIARGGLAGGLGSYLGAGINEVLPVPSIGTDGGIMSLSENASPEEFAQALMNTGMGQFRQAMTPEYWANKVANQFGQEMLGQTLETILPSAKGDVVSDYFNRYMRQQQLSSGNVQGSAAEAMDTGSPEAMQEIQQDPNRNYNPTVASGVAAPSYLDQLFSAYTQAQNREPAYGVSKNLASQREYMSLLRQMGVA